MNFENFSIWNELPPESSSGIKLRMNWMISNASVWTLIKPERNSVDNLSKENKTEIRIRMQVYWSILIDVDCRIDEHKRRRLSELSER